MEPNENYKGCAAEYLFATECSKRGYIVSMPLLDSSPYDAIVDTHKRLYKIQIKYTAKKPEGNRSSVHLSLSGKIKDRYPLNMVDFFAIYSEYFGGFFIIPNVGNVKAIRISKVGKYSNYFSNFAFSNSSS